MDRMPPKDLRAFLKFCLDAGRADDGQQSPVNDTDREELTPERREWLRKALDQMTVDVADQLSRSIRCLTDESVIMNENAENIAEPEEALDVIEDWTGNLDLANSFHKLGGFQALKFCMDSPHDSLVTGACNAAGIIAQSGPYCQQHLYEDGFLKRLLLIVDDTRNPATKKKAVFGVSCMTRSYEPAMRAMGHDEWGIITRALLFSNVSREDLGLRARVAFFLAAAIEESRRAKADLTRMGLTKHLVNLLDMDHSDASEQLARCLLNLISGPNRSAVLECMDPLLGFVNILDDKIKHVTLMDDPSYNEELEHYNQLMTLLFPKGPPAVNR